MIHLLCPARSGPLGGEAIGGEANDASCASASSMLTNNTSSHTPGSTSTSGGAPHDYMSVPCLALGQPDCVLEGEGWSLPAHKAVLQGEGLSHGSLVSKYCMRICAAGVCSRVKGACACEHTRPLHPGYFMACNRFSPACRKQL